MKKICAFEKKLKNEQKNKKTLPLYLNKCFVIEVCETESSPRKRALKRTIKEMTKVECVTTKNCIT